MISFRHVLRKAFLSVIGVSKSDFFKLNTTCGGVATDMNTHLVAHTIIVLLRKWYLPSEHS